MQGAQDAKRAKVWGTIAKRIIQAAKACGGDPANARLIEVLKLAKAAEVPKDLIDRNIKKATDKAQADYQEVIHLRESLLHCDLCSAQLMIAQYP